MKIIITERQFDLIEQELSLSDDKPEDEIKPFAEFTDIRHGEWPTGAIYINGVSTSDKDMLSSIKQSKLPTKISFKSVINPLNTLEIESDKLYISKNNNLYILKSDYPEYIKKQVVTNLYPDDLKKLNSGFPEFITKLLFEKFKDNLGLNNYIILNKKSNKYIVTSAMCESNIGLIVDVNNPIDPLYNTNVNGQVWSILNFFDTNPKVIKQLLNWYYDTDPQQVSLDNFKSWIVENQNDLFDGIKLKVLVNLNFESYNKGTETENYAINHLINKLNVSPDKIQQFCAGTGRDRKQGVDFITIKNGVESTFQVKPLSGIKTDESSFIISTYKMKNYSKKVQYLIFANKQDFYIFENYGYVISDGNNVVTINKESLVYPK
jgi:hypothetical protein